MVRHPDQFSLFCFLRILRLNCSNASFGQLHLTHLQLSQSRLDLLMVRPSVTPPPELVLVHQRPELASGKLLPA
jgi:hypothetical protein